MKGLFAVLLGLMISSGAYAQQTTVAKEITGYKDIMVAFSESAGDCNLKEAEVFKSHLKEKLAEIGIVQRDDLYSVVTLGISGQRFGAIGGHCVTNVEMTFLASLSNKNIVSSDERLKVVMDRLKVIPITFYKDAAFSVQAQVQSSNTGEPSKASEEAALGIIDGIVERLKAKRQ